MRYFFSIYDTALLHEKRKLLDDNFRISCAYKKAPYCIKMGSTFIYTVPTLITDAIYALHLRASHTMQAGKSIHFPAWEVANFN